VSLCPGGRAGRERALLWAASKGAVGAVEVLLAKGGDPNAANAYQRTPLSSAAEAGHTRVCEILLDRGAAINGQTDYGSTALMGAAVNGHGPVVKLLLARGADATRENHDGLAAWELARDPPVRAIFKEVRPVVYTLEMRISQSLIGAHPGSAED
jgi:ankyrin repeat protein